jgi:Asparagine synthase
MPFLDWRLVCYAFSTPDESKVSEGFAKRLLREAMRGVVPEPLRLRRDKLGFTAPVADWLGGPPRQLAVGRAKRSGVPGQRIVGRSRIVVRGARETCVGRPVEAGGIASGHPRGHRALVADTLAHECGVRSPPRRHGAPRGPYRLGADRHAIEASNSMRRLPPRGLRRRYLPREVFFFGFGFVGFSLPAAVARAFCFFVATHPPIAGAATVLARRHFRSVFEPAEPTEPVRRSAFFGTLRHSQWAPGSFAYAESTLRRPLPRRSFPRGAWPRRRHPSARRFPAGRAPSSVRPARAAHSPSRRPAGASRARRPSPQARSVPARSAQLRPRLRADDPPTFRHRQATALVDKGKLADRCAQRRRRS